MHRAAVMVDVWVFHGEQHAGTLGIGHIGIVRGDAKFHQEVIAIGLVIAVVDEEAAIILVVRVERHAEQALLEEVDLHRVPNIEEWLFDQLAVLDDADVAHSLDYEEPP